MVVQLSKREFLIASAALSLAAGLRSANAATAINYWHHFASQSEMAGLAKIIQLFAAANPDVAVTQEGIPNSEYMAKVSSAVVAGGRPDTGMVIAARFADLTAMGALVDISARVNNWAGKANLPDNRWTGMSQDGKPWRKRPICCRSRTSLIANRRTCPAVSANAWTSIVYVTHDQIEAMTLATKVAVMKGGHLQQLADPRTVYDRPANIFVAGFIGSPR